MKKVTSYIQRKSLIYKTGVEYGDYTMNHILGCSHGCKYPCYAFMLKKRFGIIKNYEDWICPSIVENTLDLLDKEIPKYKDKIKILHLCFTTDPFMYQYEDIAELSFKAIEKVNAAGIKCSVLTKGILPQALNKLSSDNEYGITLVSLNEEYVKRYEPGAAPVMDRIESLRYLHNYGKKTWVSIEPYPTPNIIQQDLTGILNAVEFVDKIIFGRTNYSKEITAYKEHKRFYNEQTQIVIDFCKEHNISYHIKEGTLTG